MNSPLPPSSPIEASTRANYAGVDYGTRRIGLAKQEHTLALPWTTLHCRNEQEACATLVQTLQEAGITHVIMGLPLNMDGSEGMMARRTKRFAKALTTHMPKLVLQFWDERLSSQQSARALQNLGLNSKAQKGHLDAAAATLLLQSYLDAQGQS